MVYRIKKIKVVNLPQIIRVALILHACGKDMAKEYNLHHWDNSILKSIIIVYYCMLKNNDVYMLYEEKKPIATFQTRIQNDALFFEKLGTIPSQHGKGVGSYCLTIIEDLAIEKGLKRVVTEAFENGQHALHFYQNRGYKITGYTYSIRNRKEVVLEKKI